MSGYDLTKQFDSSLRFVWAAGHSQIYPELARLEEEGFIVLSDLGSRQKKIYSITRAGRVELRRWLLHETPNRRERSDAYQRVFFLWTLKPEEAVTVLRAEESFHRDGLRKYLSIRKEVEGDPRTPWGVLPVELGIRYKRAMLNWIQDAMGHFESEARRQSRQRQKQRAG
jgi:PadR family transcriptional regulator AphA